jgi:hypothetical protein
MAKRVNLVIDQGSTFATTFELVDDYDEPLVVSDYTSRGQMRKHYEANSSTSFVTALATGQLTISLTAAQTANLTPQRYVYDIELVDTVANSVTRIVEGFINVTPEATKI